MPVVVGSFACLEVEMTAGMLKMRSRNRSCTSHAKKTVEEGRIFPSLRDADSAGAAISRPEAPACTGTDSGELLVPPQPGIWLACVIFPSGVLQDTDGSLPSKKPCALATRSSTPSRIQQREKLTRASSGTTPRQGTHPHTRVGGVRWEPMD